MSGNDRLSAFRARMSALAQEGEEQRGLRERHLAEVQAQAEARRDQIAASIQSEIDEAKERAERTSAAGGWELADGRGQEDERTRFGFEDDQEFGGEGTPGNDREQRQPRSPLHTKSEGRRHAADDDSDEDFEGINWLGR